MVTHSDTYKLRSKYPNYKIKKGEMRINNWLGKFWQKEVENMAAEEEWEEPE